MELYPILSQAVVISAVIASIFKLQRMTLGLLIILAVILVIPINQIAIWQYSRALVGDFSISLSLVAVWALYLKGQNISGGDKINWQLLNWIFIPLGLLLYPFALGLTMIDPYVFGYNHGLLIVLIGLSTSIFLFKREVMLAIIFSSVLLAYSTNLLESTNLWDYLIDPLLFLFLVIRLILSIITRMIGFNILKYKR